jgi:chloramphenicol 3-O-phosphotransferase
MDRATRRAALLDDRIVTIFGPPGSGKSSIISAANAMYVKMDAPFHAIDFEDLAREEREKMRSGLIPARPALSHGVRIIGGADFAPRHFGSGFVHVCLLPPRSAYDQRRAARDRANPGKAEQPDCYETFRDSKSFDYFVDAIETTPLRTLMTILTAIARGAR